MVAKCKQQKRLTFSEAKKLQITIVRMDPKTPGAEFHCNPTVFKDYCVQQVDLIEKSGHPQIAKDITQLISNREKLISNLPLRR